MSVYNKILHGRGLRLLGGIVGAAIMASAINLFIVPQGFYAGGAYGLCQVIRTLLVTRAGVNVPFDLAGLLYLLANLPMFYLAYRGLGRTFFAKATIVTVCNSIFSALIPSPAVPIIADPLTSCLIGGLGVGFAAAAVPPVVWTFWDCTSARRIPSSLWDGSASASTYVCTRCACSCSTPPRPSTPLSTIS